MSRIRTLEFLPEIFQTPTNSQFLGATLDQLVNPPVNKTIQGYVGSRLGYGVNAKNYYVTEPTKERTDYQLEPGIVFKKEKESVAKDFISYPGIINSLKTQDSITDDNNKLFESQIYSFDPFCSYDPIINFNQYYWLPNGAPNVRVAATTVYSSNDYIVDYTPAAYNIRASGTTSGANNPTITLLRGGTYNFVVDQDSQFWIQGEPGTSGYSLAQPNQYVRDIYGVSNNGANVGVVSFTVPAADAQNDLLFPGNNLVDVVSTIPFADINGVRLSNIGNIDGITSLNGRTVMFYNTGITNEIGYVSNFYDMGNYDDNYSNTVATQTVTATATDNTGNITVSNAANIIVGSSITFTGTSFGGIQPYDANVSSTVPATSMTIGTYYYIQNVGTTDWINAGVISSTAIDATIVGTQLIVDTILTGAISIGQTVTGIGVSSGTIITDYDPVNTALNGKPTYTVNISQTVTPSTTLALYDIKPGKVFSCTNIPVTGNGTVAAYNPTIYYVANVDTMTNQIQISETLNGPIVTTYLGSGSMTAFINQGLYEEGYYTTVNDYFYLIEYVPTEDPLNPILRLTSYASIPVEQKITANYGTAFQGLHFVKYASGVIALIPYISAPLTTLYYQDGSNPNCVGKFKIIENNILNTIDVETDILGQTNYTAPNGVEFTNGLKIKFDGDIIPVSYLTGEYYVEGVGTTALDGGGIQLIPVDSLVVTEEIEPGIQDYITIARNSLNKNAWARSNRWFHSQVIQATAEYNDDPEIMNTYATAENKAKRPILQFYPNLKLYNSGTYAKETVDFMDTRTTDAFQNIEGQASYYPDVQTYTEYSGTINSNTGIVSVADLLQDQTYEIYSLGTTNSDTWQQLGATLGSDGSFEVGVEYIITDVGSGTDWPAIGCPVPGVGTKFTAISSGTGTGTGKALVVLFTTIASGDIPSTALVAGLSYTITSLGTTQWDTIGYIGTPVVGGVFTATSSGVGTGTAIQGDGTTKSRTTTSVQIPVADVTGTFEVGQWINDMILGAESILPTGTRILDITNDGTNYTITVYWPEPAIISSTVVSVSFAADTEDNINLKLFDGARIVFANEAHESIHNKIYIVNFSDLGSPSWPVITLTEAFEGTVVENDQFPVRYGFNYKGTSFYYINDEYVQAQQKITQNQAPLFDIFDSNGISLGDTTVYNSSTFTGTKLFAYQLGTGINDSILGFPITYSSFKNVNDIRFEVSLYKDTFNYVSDGDSITSSISNGYIYNYSSRTENTRLLGWQTAVAPSQQYQVFQFTYHANETPLVLEPNQTIDFTVTCDVPQLSVETTIWPSLQVYKNNTLLTLGTDYTVENTDSSTIITVMLTQDIDTPIEILILSDQVSENAYYTIPVNLSNNPFNSNPEYIDLGDIRGQYQSIYINNPNISGIMFGANNYRDLGNLVPYGNRIIQNSASLILPGAFLRNPETNLFDALLFNSREYIKFKTLLVETINRIAYNQKYDPATLLDQAMDEITSVKSQELPFFWSDMLPCKSAYTTNVYSFFNDQDTSFFPLSKTYNFASANYNGVLVYLQRKINGTLVTKQLITGIDYTISTESPSLTVTTDLTTGDKIIVKEYNATYGSYVPNTPTKLGLYPAYLPQVVYDTSYTTPTWFIQGHDGSYNKMYGDYNETLGMCVDFRDQILLEYETRVYNNLKLSNTLPILPAAVTPGYFRTTPLPYTEFTEIYSTNFLNWVGQNRLDYKTQVYNASNPWTYNYRGSRSYLDNSTTILSGYWRGIYTYFFDTSTPNTTPWEMIGYANKPDWWEDRYGPAPYTSNNLILWTDMENGVDYNNGNPITVEIFKRPGLLNILPVDSQGNLKTPDESVIGNYNPLTYNRDWIVGDDAPVEYSYRKSSTYPFDLMRLEALIKPALFYNLAVDLDNYKYNYEFNQFLVNDRTHLVPNEIEIYGNGTAKTSYINWIVDYQKQLGVDATTKITTLLANLDARLVYRLAGFSDKTFLKFFVEKGSPGSPNPSLLIPDESYQVLLYNNVPSDKIVYSGVIVQKTVDGYAVFGNNQTSAYFKVFRPLANGKRTNITVQDVTVSVADEYGPETLFVPYGTIYYSEQEVAQFLLAYGSYLESQGMKFEYQSNSVVFNWVAMVKEFLYWSQTGWSVGSVVTLNPAAENLTIDKESLIVQPLTYTGTNFILNNNMYPIQNKDLAIFRDGTIFDVKPLNEGDALTYGQFELSNIEHGIVFDNETLFGDVIYNLQTGLKQNRIYVRGTKSAEWNGTMFASGFIYNQDNITEWQSGVKYTQGSIVKYKNKYWSALKIVQPQQKFQQNEWKETSYNEIQKGLLPNSSTRSAESALYYNVDKANLEQDADLLSFSLIGFRPRDYMASADLTDITQVNVYKNLIKDKGTLNAMKAFKGANLPQGGIDYDIYENWAILQGKYGGLLNNNFIEFKLNENLLTGNPAIIGLTDSLAVEGAQQLVPLYSLFNYGTQITNPNVLPLVTNTNNVLFQDAGYVNTNDVKMMSYYYANLPAATNKNGKLVPLSNLYVNDYVWLASHNAVWQILSPTSIGEVLQVTSNLNNTSTITFKENHNLNQYDIFAIINFNTLVNGYYIVTQVKNQKQVLINLALPTQITSLIGPGIGLKFQSHRVAQPSDIQNLPLLNNEFVKNKAWVDTNGDGNWAVYRKSINYQYTAEINRENSTRFGSAVAYSPASGYLLSDPDAGNVYRYIYDEFLQGYASDQVLTQSASFGTTIAHEQNIYAISQPTGTPKVYIYTINNTTVSNDIILYQTILASSVDPSITNFGNALALSGDLNWLYVSDFDEGSPARNNVHVYRRNNIATTAGNFSIGQTYQITSVGDTDFTAVGAVTNAVGINFIATGTGNLGETGVAAQCDYEYVSTLTSGATSIDKFGYSLSTNYNGSQVFVGAPNEDYSVDINSWGRTYVFNRLIQNILMDTQYDPFVSPTYTFAFTIDSSPISVFKNGILIDSSNYTVSGTTLTYTGVYNLGDILTVDGCEFVNSQILETEQTPRIGVGFGTSVDNNTNATDVIVGAPFALSSTNQEGAGFRYTNGGASYGVIIGTNDTTVTTDRTILLNGYAVTISAGNATNAAEIINNASINNIQATATNGKLIISIINQNIAVADQKLMLSVTDTDTLSELGIDIYTQTQVILCPHVTGPTQFGTVVKFNEQNSVAISAPAGTRYEQTLFDFTDDENLDNDTVFDNNSTQFVDSFVNAGAVYTYDYLANNNESLTNVGAYTYAQSVNAENLEYGAQPRYGTAIDWNSDNIVIGAPDYRPEDIDGQVIIYINDTGLPDWSVYRSSGETVDINKIQNIQLFSAETNNTLENLDYMDPLQGKLLGAIRQNIDVVSDIDPANYNNSTITNGVIWGAEQVGSIWLNTSNFKYINYHQNENSYNAKYWGTLFPGSDVAVYSWVASNVPPSDYQGSGTPLDIFSYSTQTVLNASNVVTPVYYFWVRNSGIVFTKLGKTLADVNLENYIRNPVQSGISYLSPLASNAVALYNCKQYINANDTVLNIGYNSTDQNNPSHQEYDLIRENYADDFLPGLPDTANYLVPESLYNRLLESLSGTNNTGAVVPDPFLPKAVQSGVLARPRQSFFYNRYAALKNYIQYANKIMALYPITEIRSQAINGFLQESGLYYNTTNYWNYVNWWEAGYDNNTKSAIQVAAYSDLSALAAQNIPTNTIVTVLQGQNLNADTETYRYDGDGVWTRIGLVNGTIEFNSYLYDYEAAGYGFGGTFYSTDTFDTYPSEETRWIVRALTEQIYIDDLLIHRNKSLVLLFEYIQEETVENQNYLPWLNKTSLVDVSHKIRELKPIQNYLSDNQEFLSGYVNETKPYHVVIKEFLFDYTGNDVYPGNITDFDVPAQYNTTIDKFVSPQLTYDEYGNAYQYTTNSAIWQEQEYKEWFSNYGIRIGQYDNNELVGQLDYPITRLGSYTTPTSSTIVVENVQGFPTNGTIKIYDITNPAAYELISYAYVNRATNVLGGLTRGVGDTVAASHLPGTTIFMDLPPVILLNGGKGYANPPKITAVIPEGYPEPRVAAEFEAVMSIGTVTEIVVKNPGSGYVVDPEIVIDPSVVYTFESTNVNILANTITLYAPELSTGDLIRYVAEDSNVGGLKDGQWYYVNVLNNTPASIVALYQSYADAINDTDRVILLDQGSGTHSFELGARAFAITAGAPVRENNITLRFDRTTYDTQITDWTPNSFYGSEFVGYYTESSSSSLQLAQVQPDIYTILASNEGTVFPIESVSNDRQVIWSSGPDLGRTVAGISSNQLELSIVSSIDDEFPSGSTVGFTIGMPVKFTGNTGGGISANTVYYVAEIIDLTHFTISATEGGPVLTLTNYVPSSSMKCYTANVVDTAIITTVYPGIRQVTLATSADNTLTAPLTFANTSGTTGLYTNVPVYFTGTTFGGIEENTVYYVVSVINDTQFTIATEQNPISVEVTETDASNQIVCSDTTGFNVNDPVVFDSMVIADTSVTTFGNIVKGQIYYVKSVVNNKVITISDTLGGSTFVTGVVPAATDTYCFVTSQANCLLLRDDVGSMTMNIGMPISPGQVDGQVFEFYPSTWGNTSTPYYLKVDTVTTFKVYSDPLCTAPVSGINFPYVSGDWMLLPEPFYFKPSIVKYNNRVWLCVISNNDSEFVFGKWLELNSGDRRLNALDRAKGYYAPTVNMPGYDLTQLFTGLTYPNATYKGNAFELAKQFTLDTQLMDQAFTPTNINIPAIVFNDTNYLAPANTPNYSGIIADIEIQDNWLLAKMATQTLALTDLLYVNGMYLMTSTNSPAPFFKSNNFTVWSTSGWFVPYDTAINDIEFVKTRLIASGLSLNAIAENSGEYIAVGNNIIITDDLSYWYERLVLDSTNKKFYDVSYIQTTGFTGYIAVGVNGSGSGIIYTSTNGIDWTETTPGSSVNYYGVTYGLDTIFVVGANRTILSSINGTNWTTVLTGSGTINDITFADNTLVAVGDNGLVLVSTDGTSWTVKTTSTTESLNSVIYVALQDEWTIVGNNNIIIQTEDITASPVVWDTTQLFSIPEPEYTVQGDPFIAGYGPEELVPGIVYDNLTMIVKTRAGTNWPVTEYAHTGYNVSSIELNYDASNIYSFNSVTQTPSVISVFKIVNGLSISLYETNDYTVDWVNKTVSLLSPLVFGESISINIYETGNGDQLVESSTDENPIITNETTGFDEVFLDCNYIGSNTTGGGIVVPGTNTVSVAATATNTVDDSITCSDVSNFILNDAVYFTGTVFGNLVIDTPYYVKSINTVANTIIVSDTLVSGVAGPAYNLITDTGSMTVVIQRGPGDLYTEPAVFRNGNKLTVGHTNYVIATNSSDNSVLTYTTNTLEPNQKITFSSNIFGGITPLTTYYIKNILSLTKFTISNTIGGSEVALSSAIGTATFVTEDYAVAMADNQINAKAIFAANFDENTDYIAYTFYNETTPQYGFTIPQTQVFVGDGTIGPYDLTNYLGGTNPNNAIVEINGLRRNPSEYTIDFLTSSITFVALAPTITDTIAVTTYNDTQRQYMFTNSYTGKQITPINNVVNNTTIAEPTTRIVTTVPHNLSTNDVVRINGIIGSEQLDNRLFVVEVTSTTEFRIYSYVHGVIVTNADNVIGVNSYISGGYVSKYQEYMLENTTATDNGSTYITVLDTSQLVVDTPVYFTEAGPYVGAELTAGSFLPGIIYRITDLGTTDWNAVAGTTAVTYNVGDAIVAYFVGTGTGKAEVYFPSNDIGYPLMSIPEIVAGQKYYISEIVGSTISISTTQGGSALTLTTGSGYNIRVTQWEQTNVDRLWVTVNGQRLPSSNLRLNDANEVSILADVLTTDEVIITSMMPSSTPDSQTYIQLVDQNNIGSVYRANPETTTWNTESMNELSTTMTVSDVSKITYTNTQVSVAPVATGGYYTIGLAANRNEILEITIYNNNPARLGYIQQEYIATQTTGLGPFALIADGSWIEAGDNLTITVTMGKLIYVNGEYMIITSIDAGANTMNVQRGALSSPLLTYIPAGSTVYGLLDKNKMTNTNYNDTWNKIPGIYNTTDGDPLQIAQGSAPRFLRQNHEVEI